MVFCSVPGVRSVLRWMAWGGRSHSVLLKLVLVALAAAGVGSAVAQSALEDPLFQQARLGFMERFDANRNGRLDPEERIQLRAATQEAAAREGSRERRGFRRPPVPPDWVERYDRDDSGDLDEEESGMAMQAESQRMQARYDADRSGSLDDDEKAAVRKDIEARQFDGLEFMIAARLSDFFERSRRGGRGRGMFGGGGVSDRQRGWLLMDFDDDGIADADELAAIREFEGLPQRPARPAPFRR